MSKRKVLALVAVLGIVITIFVVMRALTIPTISVESSDIHYGQEGYLTVKASNIKQQVAAFDITLNFDKDAIEVLEISKGDLGDELVCSREVYANTNGELTLLYLDYTGGDNPILLEGDVCYIRYKLKKPIKTELVFGEVNVVEPSGDIAEGIKKRGLTIG